MGDLSKATAHHHKERPKPLIFYETIFNTTFLQKYLVVRYKHYNFAPRYNERKDTTETNAANCIRTHGYNGNENVCCNRSLTYDLIANKC